MYRLYRFASIVVPRLPHSFIRALSLLIGFLAWLFARGARKQATTNMQHVLDPQSQSTPGGRRTLRRTVRKMFRYSARNYLEALYLPYLKREELLSRLTYKGGLEHLDEALAQGKGVVLLSIHSGPFEYIVQWFAFQNYTLTIPVEHLKDERMLELALKLRSGQGLQFVPLGGSAPLRSMMQALKKNQIVVFAMDRAIVGEKVEKPFFGAPASFPSGPISLALRTGATLVSGFGWYDSYNHMGGHLVPVSLALNEDERCNPDKLMEKILKAMEENIRARPEQWVMFSPIWTEEGAAQ
jgi:KDO2-lipid IV(A) lauroyltransferase